MNPFVKKTITAFILLVGLGLWGVFALQLQEDDQLDFEPNIACINGSPYGKILVLVMQGSISTYFHEGQRHEDAEFLKADDGGSGHEEHEHGEDCGCDAHANAEKEKAVPAVPPAHVRAKRYIRTLDAYTHRKTDGYVLTPAHRKYLQVITEDKLRFAYELDPSNRTNYEGLYLYLATNSLGRSEANSEAALALARRTLAYSKREDVDPNSLLTAASAAYDIGFYISQHPDQFTMEEAMASLAEYRACLEKYEMLLDQSSEKGFVVTTESLFQMNEQAKLLIVRLHAQEKYLKRIMSEKPVSSKK